MFKKLVMQGRLFSLIAWIGILIGGSAFSQVPEFLDYQAVIRDYNGVILANRQVGIRIQIKQGSAFGEAVYVETHVAETSDDGLVKLQIGGGTPSWEPLPGFNGKTDRIFSRQKLIRREVLIIRLLV